MLTLIQRVSWNPALKAAIDVIYKSEQEKGAFPRNRFDPTGDEQAVTVGDPADPDGFALFYEIGPRRLWLDLIWVRPTHRRQSIGSRMLVAIREHAERMGFDSIELGTVHFAGEVHGFYLKRGFVPEHMIMAAALTVAGEARS